jgi:hypothetical protein
MAFFFSCVFLRPPLWSSGQSSWLQIHRSRFDSWRYQIFWEVVGLERVPLRLMSTIKELLGKNSSSFGLENREYGRGDPLRWPRDTLCPQKLALTLPTSSGRSVCTIRSRTEVSEFILCVCVFACIIVKQNISVQKVILCYRFARSMIMQRTWYQTCHTHLNVAGAYVSKRSTACTPTSTMSRHMSIAAHVVEKWKEMCVATGVVSCNVIIMIFHRNLY